MLKIANASDIIPANAKYIHIPRAEKIASPTFTIPTGPESLFTESDTFSRSNDKRSDHKLPSIENVSLVCSLISLAHMTNASIHENVAGTISCSPHILTDTHKIHASSGQVTETTSCIFHLSKTTSNVLANCVPNTSDKV